LILYIQVDVREQYGFLKQELVIFMDRARTTFRSGVKHVQPLVLVRQNMRGLTGKLDEIIVLNLDEINLHVPCFSEHHMSDMN
jgi:hypothetical protein